MMKTLVFFRRSMDKAGVWAPHHILRDEDRNWLLANGGNDAPVRIVPAGDEERLDMEEEESDMSQINTARIAVEFFGLGNNDIDSDDLDLTFPWWNGIETKWSLRMTGDCGGF